MKRFLALAMVVVPFAMEAQEPRVNPGAVREDEGAPPEDPLDFRDDATRMADEEEPAPPPKKKYTPTTTRRRNSDLTDEQAAAVGFATICCCLIAVAGLVGLIVWLVRRSGKPAAPVQGMGTPAPHAAPPPPTGTMQLSIFALALEPSVRPGLEQQLAQAGIDLVPTSPDGRGRLVREAARALLTVQPSWRQFGYGEKPGIADLGTAESSYRSASEDFRTRSGSVFPTSDGSGLAVVTLLICSRRPLLGVSRLDDPMQVRNVLEDRMKVGDAELLGAELLWAPTPPGRVSEAEIALKFPEMMPLIRI